MATRILAIDDDPDILELYGLLLEEEGYQAHLSSAPFEDMTDVERLHPDLIILDARLRQANDGLLLCEQVRRYAPTSRIPLILCTAAHNFRGEHEALLRQGGVCVIEKPFDLANLLHTIRHLLTTSYAANRVS